VFVVDVRGGVGLAFAALDVGSAPGGAGSISYALSLVSALGASGGAYSPNSAAA
jgi:hypothetical protein